MAKKYAETFYSQKSAFQMEVSGNGIFFTWAPVVTKEDGKTPLKDDNGNFNYQWKDKKIVTSIGIHEACHVADAISTYRTSNKAFYNYLERHGFNKMKDGKLVDNAMTFFHKTEDNPNGKIITLSLDSYQKDGNDIYYLAFGVSKSSKERISYTFQKPDIAYFEAVLRDFISKAIGLPQSKGGTMFKTDD